MGTSVQDKTCVKAKMVSHCKTTIDVTLCIVRDTQQVAVEMPETIGVNVITSLMSKVIWR